MWLWHVVSEFMTVSATITVFRLTAERIFMMIDRVHLSTLWHLSIIRENRFIRETQSSRKVDQRQVLGAYMYM